MDFSGRLWGIWALVVLLSFGALEAWAIIGGRKEPKTLTEIVRRVMGVEPRKWWRGIASALLVGILAWLALHFIFKF